MIFRLSQKLNAKIKGGTLSALPLDENPFADWSAHLFVTVKLGRKRPSPLVSGKPNAWACGIVRTIGMHNFLGDKSQKPFMKIADISRIFGVGESTAAAKTATIRNMLHLGPLDFEWALPSRAEQNPLIWMLQVNGFMMDIRDAPREAQEVAFEQGLIPYIQSDRQ